MFSIPDEQKRIFRIAVHHAAARADVAEAIHNVYRALQDAIDLRRPICVTSGRCCRFDEFGHRLFVTTMEMGSFVGQLAHLSGYRLNDAVNGCPFQQDKLCSVHGIRPFGCRVFFCDQTATDWQQAQYAKFHDELKRLHEQHEIPYFYIEWREAIRLLGLDRTSAVPPAPES